MAKKNPWVPIRHEQIYLKSRGHQVDIHVYPTLQKLWDAGIQTFFSCQGGPDKFRSDKGAIGAVKNDRAYVVVLKKDEELVLEILGHLNPEVQKWENRRERDRTSIKFDPSAEAQLAQVFVRAK